MSMFRGFFMKFSEIAHHLLPYWILGLVIIIATIFSGNKNALRIEPKAVAKFASFMLFITILRIFLLNFLISTFGFDIKAHFGAVAGIPWAATLLVFWEDCVHSLPLILLRKKLGEGTIQNIVYYTAMIFTMISFGSGHIYQGILPAIMVMFYIPFSIKYGKKYGVGTVMVCHSLYDFCTIMLVKSFLR